MPLNESSEKSTTTASKLAGAGETLALLDRVRRTVPTAGLLVVPRTGHTHTSEDPDAFNAALAELFADAEAGRWLAHKPH